MEIEVIRVDFYSSGRIIPLAITDRMGKTVYIDEIKKIETTSNEAIRYLCITCNGEFWLIYNGYTWRCIEE